MRPNAFIASLACFLALAGSGFAQTAPAPTAGQQQPEITRLLLRIDGSERELVTHIYKPLGAGPFPLVIFLHGRAGSVVDRGKLQSPVLVGHANYWLRKGVAVVASIRPGYGDTGGTDRENSFARWGNNGCYGQADFTTAAVSARQVALALHTWSGQQPWVRKDKVLFEGQSVGGMTSIAAAALNLPGVVGVVNFAGGHGGFPNDSPGKSCSAEVLTRSYREFGKLAKIPSLWLYAENDQYWGAEMPQQWFAAFKAGGSDAEFVQTAAVDGHDGHQLLSYGGKMWSGPLNAFVQKVGLLAP